MAGRVWQNVVVGAGAGGAAAARGLARAGEEVLVLERGPQKPPVGTFRRALGLFDCSPVLKIPRHSREGVVIYRVLAEGGSTTVSCGNAVRCSQEELAEHGIDIGSQLTALEEEWRVSPLPETLLSEGGRAIKAAGTDLGLTFRPTPKALRTETCVACGSCTLGCPHGAKWTAAQPLTRARELGAEVRYGTRVTQVAHRNGTVSGVEVAGPEGTTRVSARRVILAAGGLETPSLLRRSGVREAGRRLFVDLYTVTCGVTEGLGQLDEPQMSLICDQLHAEERFILSPFVNQPLVGRLIDGGVGGARLPLRRTLGIMTKTADDPTGSVDERGRVSKGLTPADRRRLDTGGALAARILARAGAAPDSIRVSRPQGAHPGGGAAVGDVLDRDLQTPMGGLFVCDASALPSAPGLPPMLTISALGEWLAQRLTGTAGPRVD